MSRTGVPMLSDFGVSRVMVASQVVTESTSFKGSTRWMAPELFLPSDETLGRITVTANKKTDVWAFGMTIYVGSTTFAIPELL
jgi:serine/threonine protein kinase